MSEFDFDWSQLAFSSKKALPASHSVFISASRELSQKRFAELIKTYLPKNPIIIGIAKDDFVLGFEDQPQFRMLKQADIQALINKVNISASKHKIYTLHYFQRETPYILEAFHFKKALFVNGSWKYTFHTRPVYYMLINQKIDYERISPFSSAQEAQLAARTYATELAKQHKDLAGRTGAVLDESSMLMCSTEASLFSFDHSFQTGVALGSKVKGKSRSYRLLATACNKVVPYQTYAMHYGSVREQYFSPPNDLNHYDTVHAEVEMIIKAQQQKLDLRGTTLFINLLPCPGCARMLCETDIAEFVYSIDHSAGYAIKMLELAGKSVRRIVV
jgi:deoxycytidylate deaminase